jgi:hypothetical protein
MIKNLYPEIWKAYLDLSKGEDFNIKNLEDNLNLKKPLKFSSKKGNVMLVFNSGRLDEVDLLRTISVRRHSLEGEDVSRCQFFILDVRVGGYLKNSLSLRLNSLIWIILNFPIFLFNLIKKRSFSASLISVYQRLFRKYGITKLNLFTSNSRLVELLRMAAIGGGLQVTEYLHGICSDIFANYMRLIHLTAAHGQLSYVNMVPRLPHPEIINANLIWHQGKEVFFQNEVAWLPYSLERFSDVVIVGGHIPDGNYWKSTFFVNDFQVMNFCLAQNLRVVYCAHPNNNSCAPRFIPHGVILGCFRDYVNSTKVLVGHFSTALFMAHLSGKKILIFKEAFESIPNYFFKELIDVLEVGYDQEKLIAALKCSPSEDAIKSENKLSLGFSLEVQSSSCRAFN